MQPLTKAVIYPKAEYERLRPDLRRDMMVLKATRRVRVGDHCTVHFENDTTMRYQVHEMLRAENSWDLPGALEAEFAAYNPLIPQPGELSATLMFEYDDPAERGLMLRRLVGIERHVWLQIGDGPLVAAEFAAAQLDTEKISSVQYLKWRLDAEQCRMLTEDGAVVQLVIDHPHYRAQAVLTDATRRAIMHDPQ